MVHCVHVTHFLLINKINKQINNYESRIQWQSQGGVWKKRKQHVNMSITFIQTCFLLYTRRTRFGGKDLLA